MPPTYLCSTQYVQKILNPEKETNEYDIKPDIKPHIPGYYSKEAKIENVLSKLKEEVFLNDETLEKVKLILEEIL